MYSIVLRDSATIGDPSDRREAQGQAPIITLRKGVVAKAGVRRMKSHSSIARMTNDTVLCTAAFGQQQQLPPHSLPFNRQDGDRCVYDSD